jgi:hypothetical protein
VGLTEQDQLAKRLQVGFGAHNAYMEVLSAITIWSPKYLRGSFISYI